MDCSSLFSHLQESVSDILLNGYRRTNQLYASSCTEKMYFWQPRNYISDNQEIIFLTMSSMMVHCFKRCVIKSILSLTIKKLHLWHSLDCHTKEQIRGSGLYTHHVLPKKLYFWHAFEQSQKITNHTICMYIIKLYWAIIFLTTRKLYFWHSFWTVTGKNKSEDLGTIRIMFYETEFVERSYGRSNTFQLDVSLSVHTYIHTYIHTHASCSTRQSSWSVHMADRVHTN